MIDAKRYLRAVLDTDLAEDILLVAAKAGMPALEGGDVVFEVSLVRKRPLLGELYFDQDEPIDRKLFCRLRFYTHGILRMLVSTAPMAFAEDSPMLAWEPSVQALPARLEEKADRWRTSPGAGEAYFELETGRFEPVFSPDGAVRMQFQA